MTADEKVFMIRASGGINVLPSEVERCKGLGYKIPEEESPSPAASKKKATKKSAPDNDSDEGDDE